MGKVAEQVKTKRQWLESQMQAWQTTPKHTNAPVSSSQVIAEAKVSSRSYPGACLGTVVYQFVMLGLPLHGEVTVHDISSCVMHQRPALY